MSWYDGLKKVAEEEVAKIITDAEEKKMEALAEKFAASVVEKLFTVARQELPHLFEQTKTSSAGGE